MHVKLTMKQVARSGLSDHELKRCRVEARGNPWQVWEEDVLWWSLDRVSWQPVNDEQWQQRRRRWLMVEAEDGIYPAILWDITEGLGVPRDDAYSPDVREEAQRGAAVSDFERLLQGF
jgi:hypothetical protein